MGAKGAVEQLDAFLSGGSTPSAALDKLVSSAIAGGLRGSQIRSVGWKIFLEVLPSSTTSLDEWCESVKSEREKYAALVEKYVIDPHKEEGDKQDLLLNNPLAQAEGSTWSKFFELQELQKSIWIDVERLNMDDEVFQRESTPQMMLQILTVWSSINSEVSYRQVEDMSFCAFCHSLRISDKLWQGMHELLAPIIAVLDREKQQVGELDIGSGVEIDRALLYSYLNDSRYIEHDAFAIFERLMKVIGSAFAPPTPAPKGAPNKTTSAVLERSDRVQNTYLRDKDYELYIHLQSSQVQPQIYGMRWIRLMLGREFHLEDVLLVWDAIFSDNFRRKDDFSLLDYIMVAMLSYIRTDLLGRDNMGCLQRLLKYPPVEDVQIFVLSAIEMRETKSKPQKVVQPPKAMAPSRPVAMETNFMTPSMPNPGAGYITGASNSVHDTHQTPSKSPGSSMPAPGTATPPQRDEKRDMASRLLSAMTVLKSCLPAPSDPRHADVANALRQLREIHNEMIASPSSDPGKTATPFSAPPRVETPEQAPQEENKEANAINDTAQSSSSTRDNAHLFATPVKPIVPPKEGTFSATKQKPIQVLAESRADNEGTTASKKGEEKESSVPAISEEEKRKNEEAAQRRKAALANLLEPASPNDLAVNGKGSFKDSDLNDGGDLFGKPKPKSGKQSKSLFGDDDDDGASWLK